MRKEAVRGVDEIREPAAEAAAGDFSDLGRDTANARGIDEFVALVVRNERDAESVDAQEPRKRDQRRGFAGAEEAVYEDGARGADGPLLYARHFVPSKTSFPPAPLATDGIKALRTPPPLW